MPNKIRSPFFFLFVFVLILGLACNLPGMVPPQSTSTPLIPTEILVQLQPTDMPAEPTETPFSGESNLPELPTPPAREPLSTSISRAARSPRA
jgi:hypothetical protein